MDTFQKAVWSCSFLCVIAVFTIIDGSPVSQCPENWVLHGTNCFRLFQIKMNWTDARAFCQAENSHLASIPDVTTNTFITKGILANVKTKIWIGLNDLEIEGTYSWVDSLDEFRFKNWYAGQPNNIKNQDCVNIYINDRKQWVDTACWMEYHFLCEQPGSPSPRCPENWTLYGNNCFHLFQIKKNWTNARTHCQAENSHLASIPDSTTNMYLTTGILANVKTKIWIGLNDLDNEGTYSWVDSQDEFQFKNWYAGQPNNINNQDCVNIYINDRKQWVDTKCSVEYHFLCEQPGSSTPRCPESWTLYGNNCFHLFQIKKNWTNARTHCQAENSHLASIQDSTTNMYLTTGILANVKTKIWIGLNDLDNEGTYSWVDSQDEFQFKNWYDGQPNNINNQDCVNIYINDRKQWVDTKCSVEYHFLCEQPGSTRPQCPENWTLYGNNCFHLFPIKKNWTNARTHCQAENSHLASIPDSTTNMYLTTGIFSNVKTKIWIGLNDLDNEGTYSWVDSQDEFQFKNWYAGQPNNIHNQDCVNIYINDRKQWVDTACSVEYHFLCEQPATETNTSRTSIPSHIGTTTMSSTVSQCQAGWVLFGASCFRLFHTKKTWYDARKFCQATNSHLASVSDRMTSTFLTTNIFSKVNTKIWIGLNDLGHEGTYQWADSETQYRFQNWYAGQPNNYNGQDCVNIYTNDKRQWVDTACSVEYYFLCEQSKDDTHPKSSRIPPTSTFITTLRPNTGIVTTKRDSSVDQCPEDWLFHNEKCFFLFQIKKKWLDARLFCQAKNAHLASIPDSMTDTFLTTTILNKVPTRIWIGLNDIVHEGYYKWVDSNNEYEYKNWYPGQPNDINDQDCVHIYRKRWVDTDCSMENYFLCEKSANETKSSNSAIMKTSTAPTTTTPSKHMVTITSTTRITTTTTTGNPLSFPATEVTMKPSKSSITSETQSSLFKISTTQSVSIFSTPTRAPTASTTGDPLTTFTNTMGAPRTPTITARDQKTSTITMRDQKTSTTTVRDQKTSTTTMRDRKTSTTTMRDQKTSTTTMRDQKTSTISATDRTTPTINMTASTVNMSMKTSITATKRKSIDPSTSTMEGTSTLIKGTSSDQTYTLMKTFDTTQDFETKRTTPLATTKRYPIISSSMKVSKVNSTSSIPFTSSSSQRYGMDQEPEKKGFQDNGIVGIVVGCLIAVIIITMVVLLIRKRNQKLRLHRPYYVRFQK